MHNRSDCLSFIIKSADKGSCVVVWDQEDYLGEDFGQLMDHSTYTVISKFNQNPTSDQSNS